MTFEFFKLIQDFKIDTNSKTYSRSKGGLLAKNCSSNSESIAPNGIVETESFQSSRIPHQGSTLFGIMQNNKNDSTIFLTPVDDLLQMRPCFKYLDSSKSSSDNSDSKDSSEKLVKVGMRVSQNKNPIQGDSKRQSYNQHLKKFNNIPWSEGIYFDPKSEGSQQFTRYFCNQPHHNKIFKSEEKSADHFIKQLASYKNLKNNENSENPNSASDSRIPPLDQQVKSLMLKVHLSHFSSIIDLLSGKFNHEDILKSLKKCSYLVNGAWVVKSKVLYTKSTNFENLNISIRKMIAARDYLVIFALICPVWQFKILYKYIYQLWIVFYFKQMVCHVVLKSKVYTFKS